MTSLIIVLAIYLLFGRILFALVLAAILLTAF